MPFFKASAFSELLYHIAFAVVCQPVFLTFFRFFAFPICGTNCSAFPGWRPSVPMFVRFKRCFIIVSKMPSSVNWFSWLFLSFQLTARPCGLSVNDDSLIILTNSASPVKPFLDLFRLFSLVISVIGRFNYFYILYVLDYVLCIVCPEKMEPPARRAGSSIFIFNYHPSLEVRVVFDYWLFANLL